MPSTYRLWDFLSERGENLILKWVKDDRLTVRARASLNQKLDRLIQIPFQTAIETKMLAGPIGKHIYKLRINADVMLRPMLCRGPIDQDEYTLLLGAVETGGRLPKGSIEKAQQNRATIVADQKRRCPHVRIPKQS
jgi:hypothetical protein